MAKVPFSKLQASINTTTMLVSVKDKNDEEVLYEVKYYLPYKEKVELVTRIVNASVDDNGFYNPLRVKLYTALEVVYAYTNLNFTEKQKEDPFKLYDLLVGSGVIRAVVSNMSPEDWSDINTNVMQTIENIYKYTNSFRGVIDSISQDYQSTTLDLEKLQAQLKDPQSFDLLKQILNIDNQTL